MQGPWGHRRLPRPYDRASVITTQDRLPESRHMNLPRSLRIGVLAGIHLLVLCAILFLAGSSRESTPVFTFAATILTFPAVLLGLFLFHIPFPILLGMAVLNSIAWGYALDVVLSFSRRLPRTDEPTLSKRAFPRKGRLYGSARDSWR